MLRQTIRKNVITNKNKTMKAQTRKINVKLFNNTKNKFEMHTIKNVETGSLPYRLAFEKFILKNGFCYDKQSFFNIGVLQEAYNEIQ